MYVFVSARSCGHRLRLPAGRRAGQERGLQAAAQPQGQQQQLVRILRYGDGRRGLDGHPEKRGRLRGLQ